jgi:hypothetical protein
MSSKKIWLTNNKAIMQDHKIIECAGCPCAFDIDLVINSSMRRAFQSEIVHPNSSKYGYSDADNDGNYYLEYTDTIGIGGWPGDPQYVVPAGNNIYTSLAQWGKIEPILQYGYFIDNGVVSGNYFERVSMAVNSAYFRNINTFVLNVKITVSGYNQYKYRSRRSVIDPDPQPINPPIDRITPFDDVVYTATLEPNDTFAIPAVLGVGNAPSPGVVASPPGLMEMETNYNIYEIKVERM